MKRMVTMCALVGSIAGGVPASAITGNQPEFRKLADDVYAYIGKLNDSNAMAIVTPEGVVLVDTGNNTTDTRALLKQVQSVTKQPVRYVVITQNHNDHSGGAALLSPPAKTIVHERVAKQWASLKPHQITAWRRRFPEAEVHTFADAGHYVLEDARDEIIALVRAFLMCHPIDAL